MALKRKNILPECLIVRVALKQEKYITRVFVFRPWLFYIEGGLMFVFVFVNTCGNPVGVKGQV